MHEIAKKIRKSILYMTHYSFSSHVGSCLSIVDILYVLYFRVLDIDPMNPAYKDRDKFILSKAHGSAALYATLAERGFIEKDYLNKYFVDDGKLPGHLDMEKTPAVEISGGSLGHGLSIGVGMAVANKRDKKKGKIYVLIGDGESNEGSVWEAIMLASTLKLDNLTAIVDFNKLQSVGRTNEVINQHNMPERWRAFGWETSEVDGHDIEKLENSFKASQIGPKAIIAHTIKGKGVSFMENKLEWHYKSVNDEEYGLAVKEIDNAL